MSKHVYVFLAEGFEEIEAVATIDLLRRAGLPTHVVAIGLDALATGAHGLAIQADLSINEVYSEDVQALVLPGGLPGVTNLGKSQRLEQLLREAHAEKKLIASICAAPSLLGDFGFLSGEEAIAYPGFEGKLTGAHVASTPVVKSGHLITAKAAGYTIDFALAIITELAGADKAKEVASAIFYQC